MNIPLKDWPLVSDLTPPLFTEDPPYRCSCSPLGMCQADLEIAEAQRRSQEKERRTRRSARFYKWVPSPAEIAAYQRGVSVRKLEELTGRTAKTVISGMRRAGVWEPRRGGRRKKGERYDAAHAV